MRSCKVNQRTVSYVDVGIVHQVELCQNPYGYEQEFIFISDCLIMVQQ